MIQLQQKTRNGYKMTIFLRADRDNINCHPPHPIPLEMAFMAITMVPKFACKTKNYIYWVRNKKKKNTKKQPHYRAGFLSLHFVLHDRNFDSNSSPILAPPPLPGSHHCKAHLLPPGLRDGPCDLLSDTGSALSPPERASHTSFCSTAFMPLPRDRLPLSSPWPFRGPPDLSEQQSHPGHCHCHLRRRCQWCPVLWAILIFMSRRFCCTFHLQNI